MITEHDYDYIKFGESVIMIMIMITQKCNRLQSITIIIVISPNPDWC